MTKLTEATIRKSVEWLMQEKCGCCNYHLLTDDNGRMWSIVIGWQDGYDPSDSNLYSDGTWAICTKIAYQEPDNMMQTDFDIDFTMPYDEATGEVDDTCHCISREESFAELANYLDEEFDRITERWAYFETEQEEVA